MIRNIIKYSPSIIIPTLVTLIITVIYGNYLSPEDYGKYSLFITTVSVINAVFFSFITSSIIRYYVKYKDKSRETIFLGTYISFTLILLCFFLILAGISFNPIAIFLVICISGVVFYNFIVNVLRTIEKVKWLNIVKIIPPVFNLLIIITVILINSEINQFYAIFSLYIPMIIVVIVFYLFNLKSVKIHFDSKIIKESIRFGLPLSLAGMLNIFLSSSDRYMIGYFLDFEEVGLYSFAYRISELSMVQITMIIMLALYPQLIKVYDNQGRNAASLLISKYLNLHLIIVIPLVFIIFLFIDPIINLLFPQYIESINIIKYVSIGTFIFSLSYYSNKAFELTENTKVMVFLLLICGIVNFILNLILIPRIGTKGAIIATIIAYITYFSLSLIKSKKILDFSISIKNIFLVITSNVITTIFIITVMNFMFNTYLWQFVNIFVYIIIYSIIIYILIRAGILKVS